MSTVTRIQLASGQKDRVLPRDFFKLLFGQYFPILSMTYVASIVGMAWYLSRSVDGALNLLLNKTSIYTMALWIALWVSIPGVIWLFLKASIRYPGYAALWYKVTAGLMTMTLLFSFFLFPEGMGNLRLFIVCALPIHVFMYLFLAHFRLSQWIAQPFQFIAAVLLIYGFLV